MPVTRLAWFPAVVWLASLASSASAIQYSTATTLALASSPFTFDEDVVVQPAATLTVEAGVEIRMATGMEFLVYGTLIARGTPTSRIVFTKRDGAKPDLSSTQQTPWPNNVRLVNGTAVNEGVLQLFQNGQWRSVCTNYVNWTGDDANATCRQLGFAKAYNFTYNFTANEEQLQMTMPSPGCTQNNQDITSCPAYNSSGITYGWNICSQQRTLYLRCERVRPDLATDYWLGIKFYNSTSRRIPGGINESASVFEFVDVFYAGVNKTRHPVAALSASPFAPALNNVRLMWNAYDALNFSEVNSSVRISNCEIAYNKGHGMNITTYLGLVYLTGSNIHDNFGNGVYVRLVDQIYRLWDWRTCDMCNYCPVDVSPALVTGTMVPMAVPCAVRVTNPAQGFMSVALLEAYRDPVVGRSWLSLYNGDCLGRPSDCGQAAAPFLIKWDLSNTTVAHPLPQSMVTSQSQLTIVFEKDRVYQTDTCLNVANCVRFVLLITKSSGPPAAEVLVSGTSFSNNLLHGLLIENVRSFVSVNNSIFTSNGYGAGLRINGGAADLSIVNSVFTNNQDSGVNITYSGGRKVLQNLVIENNRGIGLWLKPVETFKARVERHQKTEILNTSISYNAGTGLKAGNYCGDSLLVVNASSRFIGNGGDGIEYISCYKDSFAPGNFSMEAVTFMSNQGLAVRVTPMLNVVGIIRNCTFLGHTGGVIRIDNTDDLERSRYFISKQVTYFIESNTFRNNSGKHVVYMRLTELSTVQNLTFRYNRLTDNVISAPYPGLNPRSRAEAVIVVSSSNVVVNRNIIVNPLSVKQVATHSISVNAVMNVMFNWWGFGQGVEQVNIAFIDDYHASIVSNIVDNRMRYNLAGIAYYPALRSNDIFSNFFTDLVATYLPPFQRIVNNTNYIGGRMRDSAVTLLPGTYVVDADINIEPGKKLIISPGASLLFQTTVGMLIQGELQAGDVASTPITFDRYIDVRNSTNWSTLTNITSIYYDGAVRLTGGSTRYEGNVEFFSFGQWGTICNRGWTIMETSVVCGQLGLTVHPLDWTPQAVTSSGPEKPIWLASVRCAYEDATLGACTADRSNQFAGCDHSMDVAIRCVPLTWSGVRLTAIAVRSTLANINFAKAGLFDYATYSYVAALQLDYNSHDIAMIAIRDSSLTGLKIVYNDPYNIYSNNIRQSTFSNNIGYGLLAMDTFFSTTQCTFTGNGLGGFSYNPHITELDAFDVKQWISGQNVIMINGNLQSFSFRDRGQSYYLSSIATGLVENTSLLIEIRAAAFDQRVTVKILDYNPVLDAETFAFYDSNLANIGAAGVKVIRAGDDLVDMPFVSSSSVLTFRYLVAGVRSGRLMMVVSSRAATDVPESGIDFPSFVRASIIVSQCSFLGNTKGIISAHYNNPSNMYNDIYMRHRFENFEVNSCTFTNNMEEAIYVPSVTKYSGYYMPTVQDLMYPFRICNITFKVTGSTFTGNGNGIVGDHNHVDFSNNIWRWQYVDNVYSRNKGGGLSLQLPIILNPYVNGNHSVDVNMSTFTDNQLFEFTIGGGFANLTIFNNTFRNNAARKAAGLMTVSGMEKRMLLSTNSFDSNSGRYVVQFDISSHAMFGVTHQADFVYNRLTSNSYPSPAGTTGISSTLEYDSTGSSYSLGVRGVQAVNISRNILSDSLNFALVADLLTDTIDLTLNASYNWWGTIDQSQIQSRIFDFQDWNSFALVQYSPFLQMADFNAMAMKAVYGENVLDLNKPLRGLIVSNLVIPVAPSPYLVVQDITVMPNVTLTIKPGVEFHILPNVGFLVLGRLVAEGRSDQHIRFLPAFKDTSTPGRRRRADPVYSDSNALAVPPRAAPQGNCQATLNASIWLCGGEHDNEGFLTLYNSTAHVWSLVCDPSFNDRTAQVFCREMGYDWENVYVTTSDLYEYYTYNYVLYLFKDLWTRTFLCKGTESSINDCGQQMNYNLVLCAATQQYVFVRCGKRNLPPKFDYWGNIRFAYRSYEKPSGPSTAISSLLYVDIYGAGILHEVKRAAVEATYQSIVVSNVNVSNCALGGFQFTVPLDDTLILNSIVQRNIGYGISTLVLNGQINTALPSSFVALNASAMPYRSFGVIDMCSAGKVIDIESRVLVYYKYDFFQRDCVKLIRSAFADRTIGIRFLQLNMYYDNFTRNYIEIFDGPDFSDRYSLQRLWYNASDADRRKIYRTTVYFNSQRQQWLPQNQIGVMVHASPASGQYGFIAEVITLPASVIAYPGSGGIHKVIGTTFYQNEGGSIRYDTVGEQNPSFIAAGNIFENNGLDILNLTSQPNILLYTQNLDYLSVSNNLIWGNNGSVFIWLYSDKPDTMSKNANVSNNLFLYNINGEALKISGNYYKRISVLFNYFSKNVVQYLNTIDIRDVIANLTGNVLYKNTGAHSLDLWGTPAVTDEQILYKNQFYNNTPGEKYRVSVNNTAVFASGYSKRVTENIFVNMDFFYELETNNRSVSEMPYGTNKQLLTATNNFWGNFKTVDTVNASVWDYYDDYNLTGVLFVPFYANNFSIVEGFCYFGYANVDGRCYRYYGGVATYDRASQLCRLENARLAEPANDAPSAFVSLGSVVKSKQQDYNNQIRAWVAVPFGSTTSEGKCPVVIDFRRDEADCSETLPFICELDQTIVDSQPYLLGLAVGLGAAGFVIVVALVFILCWCAKSRQRQKQYFERRASARSSNRSTRMAVSNATLNSSAANLSRPVTTSRLRLTDATIASTNTDTTTKSKMNGAGFDQQSESGSETPLHSDKFVYGNDVYRASPDEANPAQLEHEVAVLPRPLYGEVVYENSDVASVDLSRHLAPAAGGGARRLSPASAGMVKPIGPYAGPAPTAGPRPASRASVDTFNSFSTLDSIAKDGFHRAGSRETLDTVEKVPFYRSRSRETLDENGPSARSTPALKPPAAAAATAYGSPAPLYRPASRDTLDDGWPAPVYRSGSRDVLGSDGGAGARPPPYQPASRDAPPGGRVQQQPYPYPGAGGASGAPRQPQRAQPPTSARPRAHSQDLLDDGRSRSPLSSWPDAPSPHGGHGGGDAMKRAASADALEGGGAPSFYPAPFETDLDAGSSYGGDGGYPGHPRYAPGAGRPMLSRPAAPPPAVPSQQQQPPHWKSVGNIYGRQEPVAAPPQASGQRPWRSVASVNAATIETDLDQLDTPETDLDAMEPHEGAHSYRPPLSTVETNF